MCRTIDLVIVTLFSVTVVNDMGLGMRRFLTTLSCLNRAGFYEAHPPADL